MVRPTNDLLPAIALGKRPRAPAVRGHTLVELLAVLAIIAVLLAMLFPALRTARSQARMLACSSNLRSITLKFQLFGDGHTEEGRGDSDGFGPGSFRINDFQESLYHIDEFWDLGATSRGTLRSARELLMCPAGAQKLVKSKGFPCGRESIGPLADVSLAVNMRLYRSVVQVGNNDLLASVNSTRVGADVLSHPYTPLVIDVDAAAVVERGIEPFYIAPPRPDTNDPYSFGRYWMPSDRHGGRTNVGFVGGHVLSSSRPAAEPWSWDYQAHVDR
ncbi:MAG: prepilin-type N-terminal cleavage/methylation domain-containing protein [bacterium]|nr:prepilin-type N-terminal cleavage/methylation domain-containing protein [bacterium]